MKITAAKILLVVAGALFLLAAFKVTPIDAVETGWMGMAVLAAAWIVA